MTRGRATSPARATQAATAGTPHPIEPECLFYSETEAATKLGLHRTTLRALALAGRAPVEPISLTEHRRVYRRVDILRLAGIEP